MIEAPITFMNKPERACNGCTACCEGWLSGNAYGRQFYRGRKCFYLGTQCTIYEDRPESPCKTYNCVWLMDEGLPEWLRPDLSHVIITARECEGVEYFDVVNTDEEMTADTLNYVFTWALANRFNVAYRISGYTNKLGTEEFLSKVLPNEERYD